MPKAPFQDFACHVCAVMYFSADVVPKIRPVFERWLETFNQSVPYIKAFLFFYCLSRTVIYFIKFKIYYIFFIKYQAQRETRYIVAKLCHKISINFYIL